MAISGRMVWSCVCAAHRSSGIALRPAGDPAMDNLDIVADALRFLASKSLCRGIPGAP